MNRFARAWLELLGTPAGESDRLTHWREQWALDKRLADDMIESMELRHSSLNRQLGELEDQNKRLAEELTVTFRRTLDQEAQIRRLTSVADEAVTQRDGALSALRDAGQRVDKLVDHLVDLKREGFSVQPSPMLAAPEADVFPAVIERALNMRSFDDRIDRMNRQYALEQLRERPDDADKIALEIIRGELENSPEGTEHTEEAIAAD